MDCSYLVRHFMNCPKCRKIDFEESGKRDFSPLLPLTDYFLYNSILKWKIKTDQPIAAAAAVAEPTPMQLETPTEVMKEDDTSMSESDLLKLKKINFKKKVSGKLIN